MALPATLLPRALSLFFLLTLFSRLAVSDLGPGWWKPKDTQFDPEFDPVKQEIVKQGLNEMMIMISHFWDFYDNPGRDLNRNFDFDTIFKHSFPLEDKDHVLKVLDRFRGNDKVRGPKDKNRKNKFLLEYPQFWQNDPEGYSYCKGSHGGIFPLAYVLNPWVNKEETVLDESKASNIRLCLEESHGRAFSRIPMHDDKRCPKSSPVGRQQHVFKEADCDDGDDEDEPDELDTYVSRRMITSAQYYAHKYMHVWEISWKLLPENTDVAPRDTIEDVVFEGEKVYGPLAVRRLANSPESWKSKYTADAYAWLLTEIFWTLTCQTYFDEPESNYHRPIYVGGEPEDDMDVDTGDDLDVDTTDDGEDSDGSCEMDISSGSEPEN